MSPKSLSRLVVHSIFSTKGRMFLRSEEIRNEIYAYIAGILKNLKCHPIKVGGMEEEEVRELLKRHRVAFDERSLWD
jgi:hypothetical protein